MTVENKKLKEKEVIRSSGSDSILPFALVYICYIILHGHLSPGGGFQGGVLVTAIIVLVYLGHGYAVTARAFSYNLLHHTEGFASTVYVALALMGCAVGAQFAQNILYTQGRIGELYSAGTIFWMNVTVGVKVFTGIGSVSLLMLSAINRAPAGTAEKEAST